MDRALRTTPLRRVDAAALIRGARIAAGLTQAELAAAVRTTQSAISRWEAGDDVPGLARLGALLGACGVEADVSLRRHDEVDRAQIREHLAMTPRQRLEAVRNVSALRSRARSTGARTVRP